MIQMKYLKLLLLVCLCFCLNVQAQQLLLDRPFIEMVSVDPVTGLITIDWNVPSPKVSPYDVDYFVLFWFKEEIIDGTMQRANFPLCTIPNPDARSYTFDYDIIKLTFPDMPDPRKASVSFSIGSEGLTPNMDVVKSLRAFEHYNTQINSYFDSCKLEIRLNWHQYKGWATNEEPYLPFKSYTLMCREGSGEPEIIIEFPEVSLVLQQEVELHWKVKIIYLQIILFILQVIREIIFLV